MTAVTIVHPAAYVRPHAAPNAPAAIRIAADYQLPRTEFLTPRDLSIDERQAAFVEYQAEQKALADAAAAAAAAAAAQQAKPVPAARVSKPAAAPAPAPAPNYGSGSVQDIIRQAFSPYGQTGIDWG